MIDDWCGGGCEEERVGWKAKGRRRRGGNGLDCGRGLCLAPIHINDSASSTIKAKAALPSAHAPGVGELRLQ